MVNGVNDTRPDDLDALVGRVLIDVRRNVVLIPWWLRAVSEHRISPWLVAPHSGWRLSARAGLCGAALQRHRSASVKPRAARRGWRDQAGSVASHR
jgi:hypothetical protein